MKQQIRITTPADILAITGRWKKRREENFLAITLNGAHAVIRVHHITKGIVNRTIVHPRECFLPAIKDYSTAIAFVHNHPSGSAEPSPEDDTITNRLCMAGSILGINVLDHIIIVPNGNYYYSYRRSGKIKGDYSNYELKDFIDAIAAEDNIDSNPASMGKESK
jgi:DNA repair protein RadC